MRGQKNRGLAGNRSEPTRPLKHANKIIAYLLSGMQVGAVAAILISMATGTNYQAVFTMSLSVAVLLLTWRV